MILAIAAAAILTGSGSAYASCDGSTTQTASGKTSAWATSPQTG